MVNHLPSRRAEHALVEKRNRKIKIGHRNRRLGGKILSADSMYILANKATAEELSECPQHLIIENKYY